MKQLIPPPVILTALLLKPHTLTASASRTQKGGEKSKGSNDHVKLYSDAIVVVEVRDRAEKRPPSVGATFLRLRVKSETPIDVRLYYSTRGGGLAFSDYMNKKSGDESTNYACHPKARYKAQTHSAGSDKWPSL